jgi:putative GTP pyrophosphokinase
MIYRYANPKAPIYDGLSLELQFRTRLQHAWATAVETMGTFLGQALKSGQGERQWRRFFAAASAALSVRERAARVPGYERHQPVEIFEEVAELEKQLHVLEKLEGFAIAADKITKLRGQGAYHLIILNSIDRSVSIQPYPLAKLEQANRDYAAVEVRASAGEAIEAVLVSAGPVDALRKAYPNYFLDTQVFVAHTRRVILLARRRNRSFSRRPPRGQGRLAFDM